MESRRTQSQPCFHSRQRQQRQVYHNNLPDFQNFTKFPLLTTLQTKKERLDVYRCLRWLTSDKKKEKKPCSFPLFINLHQSTVKSQLRRPIDLFKASFATTAASMLLCWATRWTVCLVLVCSTRMSDGSTEDFPGESGSGMLPQGKVDYYNHQVSLPLQA